MWEKKMLQLLVGSQTNTGQPRKKPDKTFEGWKGQFTPEAEKPGKEKLKWGSLKQSTG